MTILAIDQGTTGTTTIIYDKQGHPVKKAYQEFNQIYPRSGWVEHDPLEIWQTVLDTCQEVLAGFKDEIEAIGITNQRETVVLWDKKTGEPIYNAIVWQCRRTANFCKKLQEHDQLFRSKTGLPIDAYFSGTKIKWILEEKQPKNMADIMAGTIDTWLIWKLTDGQVHATDYTNASRTLIYNINDKKWDKELCDILEVPDFILPTVKNSSDDFGSVETISQLKGVPIYGVAGDQQAALFGQTCFNQGEIKNTYGTGCFLMLNTGSEPIFSKNGLLTTLAINDKGEPCYALEGSIFIGGASIQWLRDELKILTEAGQSEEIALGLKNNEGVYLVPAFVGLGAPHWNMQARGILTGLTRGTNRKHLIRAALESMAYQTYDVVKAMVEDTGLNIGKLAVDGGAIVNNFLMQFQADLLDIPILCPEMIESTSLGVAYLAGLKSGAWTSSKELKKLKKIEREFKPKMDSGARDELLQGWQKALRQAMTV